MTFLLSQDCYPEKLGTASMDRHDYSNQLTIVPTLFFSIDGCIFDVICFTQSLRKELEKAKENR